MANGNDKVHLPYSAVHWQLKQRQIWLEVSNVIHKQPYLIQLDSLV